MGHNNRRIEEIAAEAAEAEKIEAADRARK